ncbi:NADH-quinone oxidoreductase subunit J [Mucilaginibacter jinjuensis]|uniref:NADH-quinone oxidoreductase subunit J n=1 Tax=Mucilaginibacter jinjuensis TaxID=1176721 RepID=A0ABY7TBS5_9SPHI|nr:NADH-quinone oxidoreductase subunit J [Mucilaginibacter jinjuensis]WCT13955.1 NADH-quinone oxidoreductase subunit J [Mucilaginibacter jinjuensis]
MNAANILFYIMSFIVLASALYVAVSRHLVRSVFMFFVTLFGLAGLYVLSLADFVAVTQIVVYVGGILVLILFAFMLSGRETLDVLQTENRSIWKIKNLPAMLIAGLFFIILINVILQTNADHLGWITDSIKSKNSITNSGEMTANIGINLMTRYLLPFEIVSILLMMALVGAAHLSRKEQQV